MTENIESLTKARDLLSPRDQKSVEILYSLQDSDWFRKVDDDVQLYNRVQGELKPSETKFPVDDFLNAVDYYYDNRDLEISVNEAMREPDGVVDIYSPHIKGGGKRQVVARVKNYFVPQILEFAYLIVRADQKKDK